MKRVSAKKKKKKMTTQTSPSVCIIGPGIVGLATGRAFLDHGVDVSFLGGSPEKVKQLKEKGYKAYGRGELFSKGYDFDISMLTVPTPTQNGKIDYTAIKSASSDLGKRMKKMKKYHLVVVKSTVPPGTTESVVIPLVEKYSGKKIGKDFGVCMNPEYLREATAYEDSVKPWVIVIGEYDKKSGDMLESLYLSFDSPLYRVTLKEAEMQKYVHNLFNATKISFFNEMRTIAAGIGADAERIFKLVAISTEGIWNPEYGLRNRGPYSGSCLPKDTQAFLHWAKGQGFQMELLESVIAVNDMLSTQQGMQKFQFESEYRL